MLFLLVEVEWKTKEASALLGIHASALLYRYKNPETSICLCSLQSLSNQPNRLPLKALCIYLMSMWYQL